MVFILEPYTGYRLIRNVGNAIKNLIICYYLYIYIQNKFVIEIQNT